MNVAQPRRRRPRRTAASALIALVLSLAAGWWQNRDQNQAGPSAPKPGVEVVLPPDNPAPAARPSASTGYDLESDERLGGHTLRRHVGRTDEQLRARLRQEPDISAASTFADRDTAARVVADALRRNQPRVNDWKRGSTDKPNLSVRYQGAEVIGRSLSRRAEQPVECRDANVVLMWKANRPVVLTAYPEPSRGR